jgi:uncharacterized DUF497 family protein
VGQLDFEWDERKNTANKRQHGISFEEGKTVFLDENALLINDPDHSTQEERFIMLGLSRTLRALVVCHCCRQGGDVIRLISARRANRLERGQYQAKRTQ